MHTFIQIYWCIIGVNVATVYQCHHLPSSASLIMHDGFDPVCLNIWILQTAYFNYRHHYGTRDIGDNPTHESVSERYIWSGYITCSIIHYNRHYRFVAYRQFTHWCWGWLGRRIRVTLPSCVVNKIRSTFPSPDGQYIGFKYPSLS